MKYHIKVAASGRLEFWKSRCVAKTHLKTISLAPAARSGCCGLTRAADGIVAAHEKLSSSSPSQGNCCPTGVWKHGFDGRIW